MELNLERNKIGPAGALQLIRATSTNLELKKLNLDNNATIGYDGLRRVGDELVNSSLVELSLSGVAEWVDYHQGEKNSALSKKSASMALDQDSNVMQATRAFLNVVQNNVKLQQLNLSCLHLPSDALAEIQFYVGMNAKSGRYLLRQQETLPTAFWCFLLAKIKNDASAIYLLLQLRRNDLARAMVGRWLKTYPSFSSIQSRRGSVADGSGGGTCHLWILERRLFCYSKRVPPHEDLALILLLRLRSWLSSFGFEAS